MKTLPTLAFTLMLATSGSVFAGADIEQGKSMHDESCTACHDSSVYTREDRRVKDLAGLSTQVRRCQQSQGLTWFDEDVENVVQYLNVNYYKF